MTSEGNGVRRVPAEALERLLRTIVARLLSGKNFDFPSSVRRVEIHPDTLEILVPVDMLAVVRRNLRKGEEVFRDNDSIRVVLPVRLRFRGGRAWADGAV